MFEASVTLSCSECGKEFQKKKSFLTKQEASDFVKKETKRRKKLCATCYKKLKTAQYVQEAQEGNYPDIQGKSEKQVELAVYLRGQYMEHNKGKMERAMRELSRISLAKLPEICRQYQMTELQLLEKLYTPKGLYEAMVILLCYDASTIIDTLIKKR